MSEIEKVLEKLEEVDDRVKSVEALAKTNADELYRLRVDVGGNGSGGQGGVKAQIAVLDARFEDWTQAAKAKMKEAGGLFGKLGEPKTGHLILIGMLLLAIVVLSIWGPLDVNGLVNIFGSPSASPITP